MKSVEEAAKVLRKLGICDVTDEIVKQVEGSFSNMPEELLQSMNVTTQLLSTVGSGKFDYGAGSWEPTSSQVYSFDMEVFDVGNMYTNFMNGILAISGGEFELSQVQEGDDDVDWKAGAGEKRVSFCYNGTPYCFQAMMFHDWFDVRILDYMNDVFARENNPKRLLAMSDGYQEIIILYNTLEWAEEFAKKTGSRLSACTDEM